MRREFCDRCGVQGGTKLERIMGAAKVVRVTWVPLARVMDLCGPCRKDLDAALDDFIAVFKAKREVELPTVEDVQEIFRQMRESPDAAPKPFPASDTDLTREGRA